jgi:DNA-binding transcriptional LysR family regulator
LTCCAVPLELPAHAVTMMWHPRFTADPAHRWFRELMVDAKPRAFGRGGQ